MPRPLLTTALALALLAPSARGDFQPTDEEGDTRIIDTGNAAEFTMPNGEQPDRPYEFSVKFAGEREQTVTIFCWATDDPAGGRWERRAFVNSYYQGSETTSRIALPAGRKILVCAWHKDADFPASRHMPWQQSRAATPAPAAPAARPPADPAKPDAAITLEDGAGGKCAVSLKPATEK